MEKFNNRKAFPQIIKDLKIGIIDRYIIKKFLGTFFFSIVLILAIAIVFDFTEKIDDFMEKGAPARAIIFDYYMNFVPYFATLFSPLFVFISVIYFTSKMAYNTEIVAILNSGMSFSRLMWPYFLSSLVIAILTFLLTNFIIPHSNLKRIDFEAKYYRSSVGRGTMTNIHRQVYKNIYVYMESYSPLSEAGHNFSIEKFDDYGKLESKLMADVVRWDSISNKWSAIDYYIRNIIDNEETIRTGRRIDTTLTIKPDDFARNPDFVGTMNYRELYDYIDLLRLQGSDELKLFLIEKNKRYANPFSVFILALIGVSLSTKKVRGGIGMQIGLGLALSFSYILFQQFASQFSLKGNLDPMLAIWIPNLIFTVVAASLFRIAPK
jgi:lipopolysaccharide export system permease protein